MSLDNQNETKKFPNLTAKSTKRQATFTKLQKTKRKPCKSLKFAGF
jgi:hypothetical protein